MMTASARRSSTLRRRFTANRAIQQLDRVQSRKSEAAVAQLGLDLQRASRIARNEQFRREREDVLDLARADLLRAFRLDEVVDSRAPAALLRVGNLEERQAGNRAQQLARLFD